MTTAAGLVMDLGLFGFAAVGGLAFAALKNRPAAVACAVIALLLMRIILLDAGGR